MRITHNVHGLSDARAALKAVRDVVDVTTNQGKRIIREGLKAGAEPIRAEAQRLAPRDEDSTGPHLADHIAIAARVSDSLRSGEARVEIAPENRVYWGGFQELGTVNHAAQPFLRPAIDSKQNEASRAFGEGVKVEIEKTAARNARRGRRRG